MKTPSCHLVRCNGFFEVLTRYGDPVSVFPSVYINIYLVHFWIIYSKVLNCGMTVGTSVKIIPFCGCCGCRLVLIHLQPAGFTYCALTPSILFLRMKVTDKLFDNFFDKLLTSSQCAHCLHITWCACFCHHPALSNSGWCCPPGAR